MVSPSFPLRESFVLAGGASSRFGTDKALALYRGKPLLAHAVDAVRALGLTPRVVGRDAARYAGFAGAFVISERPGLGPAEGLRAALRSLSGEWALVLGVDMPLVGADLLRVLVGAAASDPAGRILLTCFSTPDGRRHPLPGLYRREALATLDSLPPDTSLQALLDAVPHRLLGPGEVGSKLDLTVALRNVNRPQDLESPSNSAGKRESPHPESD